MPKMRSHTYAVSELVGSMFLIVIAVLAFSVIYSYMFPLPQLSADTHVKLQGYVDPNGFVIIEHVGGESFSSYRIDVAGDSPIYSRMCRPSRVFRRGYRDSTQ